MLIVRAIGILLGSYILFGIWQGYPQGTSAETYGIITSARLQKDGIWYEPKIEYEYTVNGQRFYGNTVESYHGYKKSDKNKIEGIIKTSQPGGMIQVHYNPSKPNISFIKVDHSFRGGSDEIAIEYLFAFMTIYLCLVYTRFRLF